MTNNQSTPLSIGMLLFPRLTQLDFTGPYEVFGRMPNTRIYLIAKTLEPIQSEYGLRLLPDTTLDDAPQVDILFVPGGSGVDPLMEDQTVLNFLRKQSEQARYITSVCTGALVLGAAGLLTGYHATTHWLSLDLLDIFGAQPVNERVVIDRNRITGGGVTSGIDFALVIAAELFGEVVARKIQLGIEYNPQPPFQSGSPSTADPAIVASIRSMREQAQQRRHEIAERAAATFHSKLDQKRL